jgi:hypothetical protein
MQQALAGGAGGTADVGLCVFTLVQLQKQQEILQRRRHFLKLLDTATTGPPLLPITAKENQMKTLSPLLKDIKRCNYCSNIAWYGADSFMPPKRVCKEHITELQQHEKAHAEEAKVLKHAYEIEQSRTWR